MNLNKQSHFADKVVAVAPAVTKLPPQKRPEVGNKDASPDETPSQILLVRQLEPNASEDVLAKGVEKLYKGRPDPGTNNATSEKPKAKVISTTSTTNLGAPEGSLLRVFLIRDKETNESWRYGFAEFYKIEVRQPLHQNFQIWL